jgi:hypothetical protein
VRGGEVRGKGRHLRVVGLEVRARRVGHTMTNGLGPARNFR